MNLHQKYISLLKKYERERQKSLNRRKALRQLNRVLQHIRMGERQVQVHMPVPDCAPKQLLDDASYGFGADESLHLDQECGLTA